MRLAQKALLVICDHLHIESLKLRYQTGVSPLALIPQVRANEMLAQHPKR